MVEGCSPINKKSTPIFCDLGGVYVTNIEGFAMVGGLLHHAHSEFVKKTFPNALN